MREVRIAVVVPVYPPYGGGIGMVARENARMLADDFDVTVFSPRYARIKESERIDGILRVRFLTPLLSYGNAAWLPQLSWILRSYDAIHLHVPFLGSAFPVFLAALFFRKKLLVTYHMDLIGSGSVFKSIFWIANRLSPVVLERADMIFVTSRDYASESVLASYFSRTQLPLRELPNSVDTRIFHPQEKPDDLRTRYGIDEGTPVILFVGGLDRAHYFKGVGVLLEACAYVAKKNIPFRLILVGDGDLRESYARHADALGIASLATFAGCVGSQEELSLHYALCDMVILPSVDRSEAFGVVLIEAGSSGRPVIASSLPGVRSVVEEEKTGFLVTPGDAHALAEKIEGLLSDPLLRKEMGRRARARVLERYSNDVVRTLLRELV